MSKTTDGVRSCRVSSYGMTSPTDVSGLAEDLACGAVRADRVICVYLKTEGNGLDNDFSRELAIEHVSRLLRRHASPGWNADAVSLVASGGCEGFLSPHMVVMEIGEPSPEEAAVSGPALAVGRALTRPLEPAEIGRLAQVRAVEEAVRAAMDHAGLSADETALVQIKTIVRTDWAHASKAASRAASALGAAIALGDVDGAAVTEASIVADRALRTNRAIVTAGAVGRSEVIVFGQSAGWVGPHRIAAGAMADVLDSAAVMKLAGTLNLTGSPQLRADALNRLDAVLVKADPPPGEAIRGYRHVMARDSDIQAPRHLRAALGGVLAGLLGTTRIFCGGGAEHQGPEGGAVLALIGKIA